MTRPKMSPKMQKRIPIVSSLRPSMPRNETWERSGSFRPASPPAVSGADWARTAVPLNNIRAAQPAPAFANRPRSGRTPASQVRISDPPSRILKQGNSKSALKYRLPAHHFALEFVLQGVEWMADRICYRLPLKTGQVYFL